MQGICNSSIANHDTWHTQINSFNRVGANTLCKTQDEVENLPEDTINLSEDAKKLAIYKKNQAEEGIQTDAGTQNAAGGDISEGDQIIQKLREQIQEIQQKIQEAQQRLIKAQSSDDSQKRKGNYSVSLPFARKSHFWV